MILKLGIVAALSAVALTTSYFVAQAVFVEEQPRPGTASPALIAERFQPGDPWDGKGKGPMSETQLAAFAEYPVFWPGPVVAGYNLQGISRTKYDAPSNIPNAKPQDSITFVYGTCKRAPGAEACVAPVTIHVQPICLVPPSLIADSVKASQTLEVVRGGATAQRFTDGHLRLWTSTVSIYISAPGVAAGADVVVASLKGIGLSSATSDADALPSPESAHCKQFPFSS